MGATGLVDHVRHRFADVTMGRQVREMPDSTGCEPARAVEACAAGKLPVQRHADVWGAPRVTLRHCRGSSASCDPARLLFAASDTVRAVGLGN